MPASMSRSSRGTAGIYPVQAARDIFLLSLTQKCQRQPLLLHMPENPNHVVVGGRTAAPSGSGPITPCVNVHCPVTAYLPGSGPEKPARPLFPPPCFGCEAPRCIHKGWDPAPLTDRQLSVFSLFLLLVLFLAFSYLRFILPQGEPVCQAVIPNGRKIFLSLSLVPRLLQAQRRSHSPRVSPFRLCLHPAAKLSG